MVISSTCLKILSHTQHLTSTGELTPVPETDDEEETVKHKRSELVNPENFTCHSQLTDIQGN
jgi:hypothetical protein